MAAAWELEAASPHNPVLHLEVGQPNFETPAHVVAATTAALHDRGHQGYTQSTGLPALREAIAAMYTARHCHPTAPENVLATHGAMFSMATAMLATVGAGDEVLVPDPGFPNYTEAVTLLHGVPVPYPCRSENGFLPDPAELAAQITPRTRLVVLGTPGNPTGAVMPLTLLERILALAQERNLFVLSDEIYGDLYFGGEAGTAAPSVMDADHFDEERTMVISGVSKSYAMTGFRVGWLRAPRRVIECGSKLQEPFISCGVPFAQRGAVAALEGPPDAMLEMVLAYRGRRDAALAILAEHGLQSYTPDGAFYVLVPCGEDSAQFAHRFLQEHRVAVAPGGTFGAMSEGYVRVSFAAADEDVAEGVRRLCRAITEQ